SACRVATPLNESTVPVRLLMKPAGTTNVPKLPVCTSSPPAPAGFAPACPRFPTAAATSTRKQLAPNLFVMSMLLQKRDRHGITSHDDLKLTSQLRMPPCALSTYTPYTPQSSHPPCAST